MLKNVSGEKGSAIVELALTLPLLSLLLIGSAELGRIAYAAIEVQDAARAGAAYGSQSRNDSSPSNYANIRQAAKNEASGNIADITFPSPGVAQYCVCETTNSTDGTVQDTAQVSCSTIVNSSSYCATSTVDGEENNIVAYIAVPTQAQVSTMFHYPGIPSTFTLNGFSEMRVVGVGN